MPSKRQSEVANPGRTAAMIYLGAALLGAVLFFLATTFTGDYRAVARYGGAAWIFLLLTIVVMPIVIPRVQKRAKKILTAEEPLGEAATTGFETAEQVSCPIDSLDLGPASLEPRLGENEPCETPTPPEQPGP